MKTNFSMIIQTENFNKFYRTKQRVEFILASKRNKVTSIKALDLFLEANKNSLSNLN